MMMLGH